MPILNPPSSAPCVAMEPKLATKKLSSLSWISSALRFSSVSSAALSASPRLSAVRARARSEARRRANGSTPSQSNCCTTNTRSASLISGSDGTSLLLALELCCTSPGRPLSCRMGSDYLPKVRGCSFDRVWRIYCELQRQPARKRQHDLPRQLP